MYKVFVNDSLLRFSDPSNDTTPPNVYSVKLENATELIRRLFSGELSPGDYHIPLSDKDAERFLVHNYEPVAAAGGIVLNAQNEVVWIFRRGKWDLPKGKADEGETMEQTALREVREECGIKDLHTVRFLGICRHLYAFGKGKKTAYKTTHWYLMRTHDTKFVPQTEEDITDIRFFAPGDAVPLGNTFRSLKDFLGEHPIV